MDAKVIFLGLFAALIFTAVTGYYPGGMIVPSYLALFVSQPLRLLVTWVSALLTCLCFRLAAQYLILFGRRRFVFMILVGGIWTFIFLAVLPKIFPMSMELKAVGWVIPGLIANYFERQGVWITTMAMVTVTIFVFILSKALYFLN